MNKKSLVLAGIVCVLQGGAIAAGSDDSWNKWAWRENTQGSFADWNPAVSCNEYTGEDAVHASHGASN